VKHDALERLTIDQFIDYALAEDIGDGDQTTLATIPADRTGKAGIRAKERGIFCGSAMAQKVFYKVDPSLELQMHCTEGNAVAPGDRLITITGSVASILKGERLALNFMQRMSGIATLTRSFVDLLEGTKTKILDTRKTTPNFREFEKYAVLTGGGVNHRFGLYDMILIKDNHIDACGGISAAIHAARNYLRSSGKKLKIEVETRSLAEVRQALETGGVDRVLLDNFKLSELEEALQYINGRVETEASGNMNISTVRAVALTGVDFISVGALTHSFKSLDISLTMVI
jgi:nicotinate-nucleotide pyrophosphorylase (carboxylating)